jgi:hypothetical protein
MKQQPLVQLDALVLAKDCARELVILAVLVLAQLVVIKTAAMDV